MTKYKSIEEKIWDSGVGDFLKFFVKGAYGFVVSQFRIPTLKRKLKNHQTFDYEEEPVNL